MTQYTQILDGFLPTTAWMLTKPPSLPGLCRALDFNFKYMKGNHVKTFRPRLLH